MRNRHFFEDMAAHLGPAYLRYSFTKGTIQEVDFLMGAMDLRPGQHLLDVGCGPGRHSAELARRGLTVTGVDISEAFVALAQSGRTSHPDGAAGSDFRAGTSHPDGAAGSDVRAGTSHFIRGDARDLPLRCGAADAAICLCQGGFGLLGGGDDEARAVAQIADSLKPGGALAISAFSSYFAVRFLEESDHFEADTGVNREVSTLRSEQGGQADFSMWTTCFTPRELRLMCASAGLAVESVWAVSPGDYARRPPDLDHPVWLVTARKL